MTGIVSSIIVVLLISLAGWALILSSMKSKVFSAERQEHARAHRLVMRLADAYEMDGEIDKALIVRGLREEVKLYKRDALKQQEQVSGSIHGVFVFNKSPQGNEGR